MMPSVNLKGTSTQHCNRKTTDSRYQAIIHDRYLSYILLKMEIQELQKIATFLWPKYSQLRMLSSSERDNPHLEVRRQLSDLRTEEAATEGPGPKLQLTLRSGKMYLWQMPRTKSRCT